MFDSLSNLWNEISNFFSDSVYALVDRLPDSPFASVAVPESVQNVIGYINWVVPVGSILVTLGLWCTSLGIYYIVSAVMRIFKIVGD